MTAWTTRRRAIVAALLIALAAAPLALAIFHTVSQAYFPAGDQAVIELRVRDVGLHTPLVGPYSRYYWNHPGPMIYLLAALPYRALGSQSTGLLAASGIVNLAAIAGIGVIAWRRGRLALAGITALGLTVLLQSLGPSYLQNPWNPYLTLLPVALFVMLAWTTVEGDRWAAPVTVLVGSFLVESHIGYALLVAAVGAWCVIEVLRRRRRGDAPPGRWRPVLLVCAAVLAVSWLPVLIDQIWGSHNLGTLIEYFASGQREPVGFGKALQFMAREFGGGAPHLGGYAPWLGGEEQVDAGSGSVVTASAVALIYPAVCFAAATSAAWRTRQHAALRFLGVTAVALVATWVSLARITDTVYNYLIRWTWVLAMVLWIAIVYALWASFVASSLPARLGKLFPVVRIAATIGVAVAVVWWGATTVRLDSPLPEAWAQSTMSALTPAVVAATPGNGALRVKGEGGFVNSVTDGLALQLERDGHPVIVEPYDAYKFGAHRTTGAPRAEQTVWVVYADSIDTFETRDDLREIARYDPLSPTERDQYRRDDRVLHDEFVALGREDLQHSLASGDSLFLARDLAGVDQKVLERYERARDRGTPVAVFLGPPVT